jgi:hypothetical protein
VVIVCAPTVFTLKITGKSKKENKIFQKALFELALHEFSFCGTWIGIGFIESAFCLRVIGFK